MKPCLNILIPTNKPFEKYLYEVYNSFLVASYYVRNIVDWKLTVLSKENPNLDNCTWISENEINNILQNESYSVSSAYNILYNLSNRPDSVFITSDSYIVQATFFETYIDNHSRGIFNYCPHHIGHPAYPTPFYKIPIAGTPVLSTEFINNYLCGQIFPKGFIYHYADVALSDYCHKIGRAIPIEYSTGLLRIEHSHNQVNDEEDKKTYDRMCREMESGVNIYE